MRRILSFASVILLASVECNAQDIVVMRDGTTRKARVLSITADSVRFVRFGTEAPVYSFHVSDLEYIEYPNGEKDLFGPQKKHGPAVPAAGVTVVPVVTEPSSCQDVTAEVKFYKVGGLYDENGVRGIIMEVDASGQHGTLVSVEEGCVEWCTSKPRKRTLIGLDDVSDGRENTARLEKFIRDNSMAWTDFPAFAWCRALGEGWYLPAVNEIWHFGTIYNGGSRSAPNRDIRKVFNDTIKAAGGKALNNIMMYTSSTECDRSDCRYSTLGSKGPYLGATDKLDRIYVRAFRKF